MSETSENQCLDSDFRDHSLAKSVIVKGILTFRSSTAAKSKETLALARSNSIPAGAQELCPSAIQGQREMLTGHESCLAADLFAAALNPLQIPSSSSCPASCAKRSTAVSVLRKSGRNIVRRLGGAGR